MISQASGGYIHVRTGGIERKLSLHIISHISPPKVIFHSYLVAQHILAVLYVLGHLVVQVPQVSHLDLAGHMTLLHLFVLHKYKIRNFHSCGCI